MSYKDCIGVFNLAKIQGLIFLNNAFVYWLHLLNSMFTCYHYVSFSSSTPKWLDEV